MLTIPLTSAVIDFLGRHPSRQKRLIAVSGGRDSVALLHALHAAGAKLIVCHLDHQLRGRASKGDADFVIRLAAKLGLPCEAASADVAELSRVEKLSLETAGRLVRHEYFGDCARRLRCKEVILAHHADDQVETILMNLLRGASGLRGMAESTEIKVPGTGRPLTLLRPLLPVTRAEIDHYVKLEKIKFREDASNESMAPVRNRLRHEVLPLLQETMGRDIRPALLRAAGIAAEEDDYLKWLAAPWAGHERLPVKVIGQEATAMQRRIIMAWLRDFGAPGCGFDEIESVRTLLIPSKGPARINLPRGLHVRRTAGQLWIEEPKD